MVTERDLIREWMVWKEDQDGAYFSQKDLAKRAGISPTYLSSIMTGTRNAGSKTIERIADAFGVSRAEFYAGPSDGSPSGTRSLPDVCVPHNSEEEHGTIVHTGWNLSWTPSKEVERLLGSREEDVDTTTLFPDSPSDSFPAGENLAAGVSKGIPVLNEAPENGSRQPTTDLLFLPRTLPGMPKAFAVRIDDDSMYPLLEQGSLVVADPDAPLDDRSGRIMVASNAGQFRVRRVERTETGYQLVPANPAYSPEAVGLDEVTVFAVILMIPQGIVPA